MQAEPSGLGHVLQLSFGIGMGVLFAILPLATALGARGSGAAPAYLPALSVLIGAGVSAFATRSLVRFLRAPFVRRPARVLCERSRTQRTKRGARTRHYATFEFEDGEQREYAVSAGLAAELGSDDAGLAITRDTVLLAFHRAPRL